VAALDGLGLAVIGRPSAMVGAGVLEQLVELLSRVGDRGVVVVAERDCGTGERAARLAAADLGARLGRPVSVVFPPGSAKDSRAWVNGSSGLSADLPGVWLEHVASTAEAVEPAVTAVSRAPVVRREELEPARPRVGVDVYRGDLRTRLADWASDRSAGGGRIAICGGPAGTGKSRAINELVVGEYDRVIIVMPSHAVLAERQRDLRALGIDAVAMPRLDEHTCESFTEEQSAALRGGSDPVSAERVQRLGLSVAQLACQSCPLSPRRRDDPEVPQFLVDSGWTIAEATGTGGTCRYWERHAEASAARVVLVTAERWRRTSEKLVGADDGRRVLVVIDEQAADAVRPRAVVSRWQLEMILEAFGEVHDRLAVDESRLGRLRIEPERAGWRDRKIERLMQELAAVDRLTVVVRRLLAVMSDQLDADELGARLLSVADLAATSDEVVSAGGDQRRARLLRAIVSAGELPDVVPGATAGLGRALLRCSRGHVDGGVLEVVRRIADGRVDAMATMVEQLDGGEGSRAAAPRTRQELLVAWGVVVPGHADVLMADGTVDPVSVQRFAGTRLVERVEPPAAVRRAATTWQYPAELTMGTSPETVAGVLERVLSAVPRACRVGVICHKRHRLELFERGGLPERVLRRISRVTHFGAGDDRASNEWQACDLLVVLGTPRPGSGDVAAELLRRGEVEALELGSEWGTVVWSGRLAAGSTGQSTGGLKPGRLVDVSGRGYGSEAWASAAAAIVRSGLIQAMERARTVVAEGEGGVPAVVVSTENLGLEVRAELPRVLSAGARRVLDVLEVGRRHRALGLAGLRRVGLEEELGRGSAPYMGEFIAGAATAGMVMADVMAELRARCRDGDGAVVADRTLRAWVQEAVEWGAVRRDGDWLRMVDEQGGDGGPRVERRSWSASWLPAQRRSVGENRLHGHQRAPPVSAGP